MRFLAMTDSHWRVDRPRWRTDSILESQILELQEIEQIVKDKGVTHILHGGDVFHVWKAPHQIVSIILDWIKRIGKPFCIVPGNHCLEGYNLQSLPRTALGTLFSSGLCQALGELSFNEEHVIVRGIEAHLNPTEGNYIFDSKFNDYLKIIFSHNYLSNRELIFPHVKIQDIKTNADLVLSGHLHDGFSEKLDNTYFINPSAISRWEIDSKNRKPKVLIIDTNPFKVEEVYLKSAKKAEEIFDLTKVGMEKEKEDQLKNFMESLEATNFETNDIEQLVLAAGKNQGVEERILNKSLEKIREAKEVLK